MSPRQPLPRACLASSSHGPMRPFARRFSHLATRPVQPIPFFTPPFPPSAPLLLQSPSKAVEDSQSRNQDPGPPRWKGEEEVDDREWEMRVGELRRAGLYWRAALLRSAEASNTGRLADKSFCRSSDVTPSQYPSALFPPGTDHFVDVSGRCVQPKYPAQAASSITSQGA